MKHRGFFLPEEVKYLLEYLKDNLPVSEWIFQGKIQGERISNIEKTTIRLKKRIGTNFTLHYLRNIIVSSMAEQGIDAIFLSGALGHSDPGTITKYLTQNYYKGSEMAAKLPKHLSLTHNK